ncbi:hypothetical protein QT971_02470 [Microcoleus sp. herbarium19]|uniref:hypothetical protein n=1 Tax=unclassified Microcoleus TaxID=2642155 RepID=UPI002FD03D64
MTVYFLPNYPFRDYLAKAFSVDYERNIPTAYSILALLFSSILLGAIAYGKNLDSDRYKNHWKVLSFIFLCLCLDEAAQIHEKFMYPMRSLLNATGFLYFTWVVPIGFVVAIFLLSYTKFLFHLPTSTRNLFVAASVLYIGGALGMEMVGGYQAYTVGMQNIPYLIIVTLEELFEMLGIIVFIHALTSYINKYLGGVSWKFSLGKNQELHHSSSIQMPAISESASRK